jgi:hypothetical protein
VVAVTEAEISTTKGDIFDWGIAGLGNLGGLSCVVSAYIYKKHSKTKEDLLRRLGGQFARGGRTGHGGIRQHHTEALPQPEQQLHPLQAAEPEVMVQRVVEADRLPGARPAQLGHERTNDVEHGALERLGTAGRALLEHGRASSVSSWDVLPDGTPCVARSACQRARGRDARTRGGSGSGPYAMCAAGRFSGVPQAFVLSSEAYHRSLMTIPRSGVADSRRR